jgi:energy-coupling factor transporter ATP-binding protein EcfA2
VGDTARPQHLSLALALDLVIDMPNGGTEPGGYMDSSYGSFFERRELGELLYYLDDSESRGVLLLGEPGSGKTTLLLMANAKLQRQHRAVISLSLAHEDNPRELGTRVLRAATNSAFFDNEAPVRTLRTSAGAPSLQEVATVLRRVSTRMPSPVLLFDGLDEAADPLRFGAAIEELSLALEGWKIVVASRPAVATELRRFARFEVLQLRGLTQEDAVEFVRRNAPGLPQNSVLRIVELANGNPLFLNLVASQVQQTGVLPEGIDPSLSTMLDRLFESAVASLPEQQRLTELLEEIALAGGRAQVFTVAAKLETDESEIRRLSDVLQARGLLLFDDSAGTVTLFHESFRDFILSRRLLARRFSLTELRFGAEEAETDELLDESFVRRRDLGVIFDQHRSIIIGDRGAGKSAIFRTLAASAPTAEERRGVEICPVSNTGDLMHRVVAQDAWTDADALRAAWLVVIAAVVASAVPTSAPKQLRRTAADLRTALGLPTKPVGQLRRALRATVRPFGGTTLRFTVGPVGLEAQLPSGSSRSSGASVDVESFLQEADSLLAQSARRVVVMFDRIDETFKYDRAKQEAVVQALLQAESRMSKLKQVGLLILLRTDLFELYDIQEKNKLVSRMLTLDWSDEDWLQVLVRRVLANAPLRQMATRLHDSNGSIETRSALEMLFPPEIEGQPVDRWLIDSLRNGNGDVSPRSAVLLLHLTREVSADPDAVVSTLPLFSAEAVSKAMTRLSDLSYSEIVNDFKVASTFVQNCRAGKLESFTLRDAENLFDEVDGKIGDQVRLLERLGFLERVVQVSSSGPESLFRIPKLYTRCWNYA